MKLLSPLRTPRRNLEGWTVRVDDRLLKEPNDELGKRALRFLENKLADIKAVVPADKVKQLQKVTIVLDLSHGKLTSMQYHPSAGWLKNNGYSTDLAKCVHVPQAADLPTFLFDLTQDYGRRLTWDVFLKEARLLGDASQPAAGVDGHCCQHLLQPCKRRTQESVTQHGLGKPQRLR